MTELERIRIAIKALISLGSAKNQEDVGNLIGYTNKSSFSQVINGKVPLTKDFIDRLCSIDKRLNKTWIVSEVGDLLKNKNESKQFYNNVLREPKEVYKLKTDQIQSDNQQIPLYNIEATAGIATLFSDSTQVTPIDYIKIPNLPKCDGAVYVTGDSMYPLLKSGDIVMYKWIKDIKDGIFWGEMYLISYDDDGSEMVMVKYIQKCDDPEFVKLVSQNKHHQDKDIKIKKIRALALIKASIRINSMS